jgi:hypothetical protein
MLNKQDDVIHNETNEAQKVFFTTTASKSRNSHFDMTTSSSNNLPTHHSNTHDILNTSKRTERKEKKKKKKNSNIVTRNQLHHNLAFNTRCTRSFCRKILRSERNRGKKKKKRRNLDKMTKNSAQLQAQSSAWTGRQQGRGCSTAKTLHKREAQL